MIIGIGGVSRAGKSTLATELKNQLKGKSIVILNQDDYVRKSDLPLIRTEIDWEHPASIDWPRLKKSILQSKKNNQLVIVEGLFAFSNTSISKLYDHWIYVHIEKDLFIQRKSKDKRWGRIQPWFVEHIWSSHRRYGALPPVKRPVIIINGSLPYDITKLLIVIGIHQDSF